MDRQAPLLRAWLSTSYLRKTAVDTKCDARPVRPAVPSSIFFSPRSPKSNILNAIMDDSRHTAAKAYEESRALERRIFDDCIDVHALPPIFHYWSQRHLRAKLLPLGIPDANDVFRIFLKRHCQLHPREPKRFASLGSGN